MFTGNSGLFGLEGLRSDQEFVDHLDKNSATLPSIGQALADTGKEGGESEGGGAWTTTRLARLGYLLLRTIESEGFEYDSRVRFPSRS